MGKHKFKMVQNENSHLVTDSHRCKGCGKGKTEVNFSVEKDRGVIRVRVKCNLCKKNRVKSKVEVVARRVSVKDRIDDYFKDLAIK